MKSISKARRICALLLSMALLCGMVLSNALLPASADTEPAEVTKFEANFDGLAAITEQQTIDYLESKFAFFYSQEGGSNRLFERPNVNGYVVNSEGVEWTGKADAAGNVYLPDLSPATLTNGGVDGVGPSWNSTRKIAKWAVDGKWLSMLNNGQIAAENFRNVNSMTVKDANGELLKIDNFKLTMAFSLQRDTSGDRNNLAVAFRSENPYIEKSLATQALFAMSGNGGWFFGDDDDYAISVDAGQYIFNKDGTGTSGISPYYDPFTTEIATYNSAAANSSFMNCAKQYNNTVTKTQDSDALANVWPNILADRIDNGAELHLELTVVNTSATVKVTTADGAVLIEKTTTLSRAGEGYLVFCGSNAQGRYADIEVTRLDVNGNPVDFDDDNEGFDFGENFTPTAQYREGTYYRNTGAALNWLTGAQTTYYTFDDTTYTDDVDTIAHLKEKFDLYAYFGGGLFKMPEPYMDSEDSTDTDDVWSSVGGAANFARWYYTKDGFTMRVGNDTNAGGEALRKGVALSPKVNGKPIYARNVELYTDLVFTNISSNYSIWNISLRSAEEGRVINGNTDTNNKYADHIGLQVRPDGINIADGTKMRETTAAITGSAGYTAYADGAKHYNVRVYAKVEGRNLTVKVTDNITGATLFEVTDKKVAYMKEGYVNIASGQAKSSISNLYVNVLEDKMTPTFAVTYKDLFPYGATKQAALGIPAHLQTTNNINAQGYLNFTANGDHFKYREREYAVADGYSLVTEGDVTSIMKDGAVVVSTADATVDAIGYTDETETVIKITSNAAALHAIVKGFMDPAIAYINERFDVYYIDTSLHKGNSVMDNGYGTELNAIYGNDWLQFTGLANNSTKKTDAPDDKHISLYVPKMNGQALKASEFDMSFRIRLNDASTFGTTYVAFNMPEEGNLGVAAESNGTIAFNNNVNAIKINSTQFMFWNGTEWVDLIADGGYTGANSVADLIIKVLDGKLTGTIQFDGKTAQAFEVVLTNTDVGYMAIGHNGIGVNFGTMSLQAYDDYVVHTCDFNTPNYDANGHWNECECGEKDTVIPHTMNGEYDENGHWDACECGYATEAKVHALSYVVDGDKHYQECACGYETEKVDHDFTEGDCACGEQKPNTAKVEGDIITVKAAEGYQLKAGALVVTDANGNRFVPERVGYRNGGDGSQYKIPANAVAPYTLPAAEELFYQPAGNTEAKDNDINVALLGTQVTDANTYGGGLRFVHRLNIATEGDKMYIQYNGEKLEVKEYGLLLAAQAVLKNPEDLDIETAEDSKHVQQYAWPEANKYFDKCSDYVDISVHVKGILNANGGDVNIITRAYVILADDTVYYGDVAIENYNNASK